MVIKEKVARAAADSSKLCAVAACDRMEAFMPVKLKISDPVIIAQGPRYKDVGWGEFQFPLVGACAEDGSVYASVQITEDSGDAYGSRLSRAFFVSKDEGEHWEALPKEEWEDASMRQALRLPSGEHSTRGASRARKRFIWAGIGAGSRFVSGERYSGFLGA